MHCIFQFFLTKENVFRLLVVAGYKVFTFLEYELAKTFLVQKLKPIRIMPFTRWGRVCYCSLRMAAIIIDFTENIIRLHLL